MIEQTTNNSSQRVVSNQFRSIQKIPSRGSLGRPVPSHPDITQNLHALNQLSHVNAAAVALYDTGLRSSGNGKAPNSRRRPMSAKNPLLYNHKFSTKIEDSTPNLLNDQVINIENIISEENMLNKYKNNDGGSQEGSRKTIRSSSSLRREKSPK